MLKAQIHYAQGTVTDLKEVNYTKNQVKRAYLHNSTAVEAAAILKDKKGHVLGKLWFGALLCMHAVVAANCYNMK